MFKWETIVLFEKETIFIHVSHLNIHKLRFKLRLKTPTIRSKRL